MRQVLGLLRTSTALLILVLFTFISQKANADYGSCSDIKIIFARGSSENPNALFLDFPFGDDFKDQETIAGSFFQTFKYYLDRDYPKVNYDAVSVHNFPDLYSSNGYPAVGIFGPKTINNIFQSELYWWPMGEYRESVTNGIEEVSGYLKGQIKDCPDQLLVVGGYSQGAHVMGDALFKLSAEEQGKVHSVALFGDPKYIGSDVTNSTPIDYLKNKNSKPNAKRWKRGTASLIDRGILDSRIPYLPEALENRTLSWCFNDDFICTGGSGIMQSSKPILTQQTNTLNKDDLGAGHKRYSSYGAPEAAQEIIQRLSPRLNYTEAKNGGKDVSKSYFENIPTVASNKPIDIMLMLNTSFGVDDILGQLRNNTKTVLPPFSAYFSDLYVGIGEYSETGSASNRQPRVLIRQQPTPNSETLITAMNRKLSYGGLSGGGLDSPDPHQLGIEKAIRATNWRPEAEKHVVILTDRPLLPSITFNMCDSVSISGFGIENSSTCYTETNNLNRSSKYHSEWCTEIYETLTQELCTYTGMVNYKYLITRSESSSIELMQASDVSVSVVLPHGYRGDVDKNIAKPKLEDISKTGGGKFIEYSTFNLANYTDMFWQILNHKPNRISLKNIQDFDNKNSVVSETSKNKPLQLFTNSKQIFNLTGNNIFESYAWDLDGDGLADETTSTPQIEHVYEAAVPNRYISVTGSTVDSSSTVRVPITVVDAGSINSEDIPVLSAISAKRKTEGVEIVWQCTSGAVIFIDVDLDNNPDISAPCSQGSLQLQGSNTTSFDVWAENYAGKSAKTTVSVENIDDDYVDPDEDGNDTPIQEDDKSENDNDAPVEAEGEDKNIENNVKYDEQLIINTENLLKMLQQNQIETTGNNTKTYNPQKTQTSDQQASPGTQKSATLSNPSVALEFDTKTSVNNFSNTDGLMSLVVFVLIPLVVIYAKIKLSFKK